VQRYACDRCGKSFREAQPLDGVRIDAKQAAQVIHLMVEGMGIRAISRLTSLNHVTVLNILETAGEHCARLLDSKIRNVNASLVQVDEIYGFVFSKGDNTSREEKDRGERGDFFTYLSVDMSSKLIINWRSGKRNNENTTAFLEDLKNRMAARFQLTTDAYSGYWHGSGGMVKKVFGNEIDYATEMKIFNLRSRNAPQMYKPLEVIRIKRLQRLGNPDMKLATTCHAERMNLSVRLFNRRFTRRTLGYSKKLDNLRHSVAILAAHFNFCRVHSAHGRTPAQAASLTDHTWTIKEMIESAI
jgi:IS1 family transposase